jgi:pyruvate,water dikinase
VFYLQLDEVLGWVDGTCASTSFRQLVAVRREEFDRYREEDDPAERFLTLGPVHRFNSFRGEPVDVVSDVDGLYRGTGCYPGIVTAPVRVVHHPNSGVLLDGEILAAARTDPGWVPLFPSVSGLLVERGSLLSHSAVVAREMGLPTVVGLRGITTLLTDGERVRLDGGAGTVERLDGASPADEVAESAVEDTPVAPVEAVDDAAPVDG